MKLDEARAEIAKLKKLLDLDACIIAGAEKADIDQQTALRRQISEWKQNFREKHEDCEQARAIARRLRSGLNYLTRLDDVPRDAVALCAAFDALPWAKEADSDS